MILTVSTLQELLESIASSNDGDSIVFSDNITVSESIDISTNNNLTINLDSYNLTIESPLTITSGNITFIGGDIICNASPSIILDGADTHVTFGEGLQAGGSGTIASVTKKSTLTIDGAVIGTNPDSGEGAVVSVEGYTNAKANSKLVLIDGSISAYGDYHGVNVAKKGIVEVQGGGIYSFSKAISKEDDTATIVTVTGGSFKGTIPDDSVDTDTYEISEQDENGVYTVTEIESKSDDDSDVDIVDSDTDVVPEPIDTDSDITSDTEDAEEELASEPVEDSTDESVEESTEESIEEVEPVVETKPEKPEQTSPTIFLSSAQDALTSETLEDSTSIALTKVTRVYSIPNIKFPLTDIIGAVKVFDGGYIDPYTNVEFRRIEYTLPGNGRKAVGYVFASTVAGE